MGHLVETAAVDAVDAVVLVVARLAAENAGFVDADGADDAVVADVGVVRLVDEVVGFAVAGAGAVAADVDAVVQSRQNKLKILPNFVRNGLFSLFFLHTSQMR